MRAESLVARGGEGPRGRRPRAPGAWWEAVLLAGVLAGALLPAAPRATAQTSDNPLPPPGRERDADREARREKWGSRISDQIGNVPPGPLGTSPFLGMLFPPLGFTQWLWIHAEREGEPPAALPSPPAMLRGEVVLVLGMDVNDGVSEEAALWAAQMLDQYGDYGLEVLATQPTDPANWTQLQLLRKQFVEVKLPFPVAADPQGEMLERLAIRGVPVTPVIFLIDATGKIRAHLVAPTPDGFDALEVHLEKLLEEIPPPPSLADAEEEVAKAREAQRSGDMPQAYDRYREARDLVKERSHLAGVKLGKEIDQAILGIRRKAKALLSKAYRLARDGKVEEARGILEELVRAYPKTDAGKTAAGRLQEPPFAGSGDG